MAAGKTTPPDQPEAPAAETFPAIQLVKEHASHKPGVVFLIGEETSDEALTVTEHVAEKLVLNGIAKRIQAARA
jgi:hypothetical protein